MPTLEIESLYKGYVGGIDEAGRGPWAGPVVACVVVFLKTPPLSLFASIEDSKKLSKPKRELICEKLLNYEFLHYGIGVASVEEIDNLNILNATFVAMKRAVKLLPQTPQALLIDGKYIPSFEGIQAHAVIGGDGKSLTIAAASILAKVTRDRMMTKLALEYPHYGWHKNAGYGTDAHHQALKVHGVTSHHRKSFAPIKALLNVFK